MEYLEKLKFTKEYWVILAPFILMILDVITGYYNSWKNKKISSKKMRDGIGKKLAEMVYILIGLILSYAFDIKAIGYFISIYMVYMELISISENCEKLGIKMPETIKDKLNNKEE